MPFSKPSLQRVCHDRALRFVSLRRLYRTLKTKLVCLIGKRFVQIRCESSYKYTKASVVTLTVRYIIYLPSRFTLEGCSVIDALERGLLLSNQYMAAAFTTKLYNITTKLLHVKHSRFACQQGYSTNESGYVGPRN